MLTMEKVKLIRRILMPSLPYAASVQAQSRQIINVAPALRFNMAKYGVEGITSIQADGRHSNED